MGTRRTSCCGFSLARLSDREGLVADLERLSERQQPYATAALSQVLSERGNAERADQLDRRLLAAAGSKPVADDLITEAAQRVLRRLSESDRLTEFARIVPQLAASLDRFDALTGALANAAESSNQAELLAERLARWTDEDHTAQELACAAWALKTLGRINQASKLHRAAVGKSGDGARSRCLLWALDLLDDEWREAAADELQWGLDQGLFDDDDGVPHYYLAAARSLMDDHDAAIEAAREAARREPDSAELASQTAWVLYNADRKDEAIAAYEELIAAFEDDPDPSTREALKDAQMTLSFLILERGDTPAAAEWLLRVLDEFPGDPGALNDLAYLWAERGLHLERSGRMAEQAVAAKPDDPAYLDTFAWAQFRLGEVEAALATVERALALMRAEGESPDGEVLDHHGDILAALGRDAEAQAVWRRAVAALSESKPEMADAVRAKLAPAE